MKTIELSSNAPTLAEILALADEEPVVIKTAEGKEFVLAEFDDFANEAALISKNEELMKFLDQRSKEAKRFSLSEVKSRLNLD